MCRSAGFLQKLADMCRFQKNDLLRNTIRTPQRCQQLVKMFKTGEKSHLCQFHETFFCSNLYRQQIYKSKVNYFNEQCSGKITTTTFHQHIFPQKITTCQFSSVKTKLIWQTSLSKFNNHFWKIQVKWMNYGV